MYVTIETDTKYVCPNCGGEMEPSKNDSDETYICKECGCCIDGNELCNFDTDQVCPNCNQPLEENECRYCGYDLGSDFE